MPNMCEGCGTKQASFGTPTERKARWCGGCGKAHDAIHLTGKMCEGCGTKQASFGTPTERKARWCGGCGKAHNAINLFAIMCEGCGAKQASFGTPTERKRRWCLGCSKAHGATSLRCGKAHGAINVTPHGAKRMRLDPPANLSTSKSTTPEAEAGADRRAHEGMASGDATSLLAALAFPCAAPVVAQRTGMPFFLDLTRFQRAPSLRFADSSELRTPIVAGVWL
eukprot:COSAG03_NODE_1881_length_3396_cov_4.252047_3_plen_224_part_00